MKILNTVLCPRKNIYLELELPPIPPTTTLIPYIYTTAKQPRRKQHLSHNNKAGHDTHRVKETLIPSIILENEIGGSVEGKKIFTLFSILCTLSSPYESFTKRTPVTKLRTPSGGG